MAQAEGFARTTNDEGFCALFLLFAFCWTRYPVRVGGLYMYRIFWMGELMFLGVGEGEGEEDEVVANAAALVRWQYENHEVSVASPR